MKTNIEHLTEDKLEFVKEHLEVFGGFFDVELFSKKMNLKEEQILNLIKNKELISFVSPDDNIIIPACQVHNFKLVEGLKEILDLNKDKSDYDKMMFLTSYNTDVKDAPIRELRKEMDRENKKGIINKLLLKPIKKPTKTKKNKI